MKGSKINPVSPDVKSELDFYEALKMPEQNDPMNLAEPKPTTPKNPNPPVKPETTVKKPLPKSWRNLKKRLNQKKARLKPLLRFLKSAKSSKKPINTIPYRLLH
jgi:hypothetical protein